MLQMAESTVKQMQALWRNEVVAVATYEQAVALAGRDCGSVDLVLIHAGHRDSAETLRRYVEHFGGVADDEPSVWNRFGFNVAMKAKLADNKAALQVLKEGEEGTNLMYEEALGDEALPEECRIMIADTLLPEGLRHVAKLERLLEDLQPPATKAV
jgi:hypothetical protein